MTFEDILAVECEFAGLPNTARLQLPTASSGITKKKAMRLEPVGSERYSMRQ